ncbi:MAG: prepilin-type N-terminal cleavage/methylation domain-containing protein [Pyrinomonadaceae bacterium]|nr:prepilin-type N-terminal cleavage/methylation domain-containing protein [Pyrinomonadaceae bacterium]
MKEHRNFLRRKSDKKSQSGFSLVELLIVVTIMTVISSISLFYFTGHSSLYKTQDQASRIIDILQLAREKALSERRTMRVTFDVTTTPATVTLIDETNNAVVRTERFFEQKDVRNNRRPANISTSPIEALPVVDFTYTDTRSIRFMSNGTVRNALIGASSSVEGVVIFVWQPDISTGAISDNAKLPTSSRAVTVLGATGAIRLWAYTATASGNVWQRNGGAN